MASSRDLLRLRAGSLSEDDLRVTRVRGREAISEPFHFDVEFALLEDGAVDLPSIVGRPALLTIRRPDGVERLVHGVLGAAELAGISTLGPTYRARLVPRLALLAHTRDSRIFQQLAVPEIVKIVLGEEQVEHRLSLSGGYPVREYCVQYGESKLAFVSRLLEEEGIFYFFEHESDAHTLVLADAPAGLRDIPGDARLPSRDVIAEGGPAEVECVVAVSRCGRVRTGSVTLRDHDFLRPASAISADAMAAADTSLEAYGYDLEYADAGQLKRLARVRLEEARVPVSLSEGESTSPRLTPGACFEIFDHPDRACNGKLQIVATEHEAVQDPTAGALGYRCRFLAQAKGAALRPRRRSRRPAIPGAQTATVVGLAGEEIHPDEHGRVKLQFHWDRDGKKDDRATCFVRVAQGWAGPGWGGVWLPRIGQEVLVRFLGADPDRPLVVGAVYNGVNPAPLALPGDRTRSTLRSESSPGGDGFNELRFEDAKGAEEVLVHAQKDETVVVEADARQQVHGNDALEVAKDRRGTVGQGQKLSVEQDDASLIGGDRSLTVAGTRRLCTSRGHSEEVRGAQVAAVAKTSVVKVNAGSAVTVGGAAALNIGGAYAISAGGLLNVAVGGARLEEVGGARTAAVGGAAELRVVQDASAAVGGEDTLGVDGKLDAATGKDLEENVDGKAAWTIAGPAAFLARGLQLEAQQKLTLQVGGKVVLEVAGSGQIAFSGSAITLDGARLALKGAQVKKSSA